MPLAMRPKSAATDLERRTLLWLRNVLDHPAGAPALYLGTAQDDRFAAGHRLLAAALPEGHVVTAEGGHDWEAWVRLWRLLLQRSPFAGAPQ